MRHDTDTKAFEFYDIILCCLCFTGQLNLNTENKELCGKTQIVTRCFRMRLHASCIQFVPHNILKVFNSYIFLASAAGVSVINGYFFPLAIYD